MQKNGTCWVGLVQVGTSFEMDGREGLLTLAERRGIWVRGRRKKKRKRQHFLGLLRPHNNKYHNRGRSPD